MLHSPQRQVQSPVSNPVLLKHFRLWNPFPDRNISRKPTPVLELATYKSTEMNVELGYFLLVDK
jgi:hypothetical protein